MKRAVIRNNMILLISAFVLFFTIAFFSLYYFEKENRLSFMTFILHEVELSYDHFDGTPHEFVSEYSYLDRRITILDENGYVIADSHDEGVGQDKSQRPEILDLGAIYIRTSDTIDVQLIYIATKLDDNTYLRVSVPLVIQSSIYNNVAMILVISTITLTVAYYYGVNRINKNLLSPLEKIKQGMIDLNQGRYQVMSLNNKYGDINELLHEMNKVNLDTSKYLRQIESYQKQLDAVLNHLRQAVLLFDQQNNITYFNNDSKDLFDLSYVDLGQPLYKLIRNYVLENAISDTNLNKKDSIFDLTINENIYEIQVISLSQELSYKKQATVLVILQNVHSERLLSQTKRDFFSHASHELKSPLTAISGNAELIEHDIVKTDKDIKEAAKIIHQQTINMTALVEDMLMLARLEQIDDQKYESQNLNTILKSTIENLKTLINLKKITITLQESDTKMICDPLDMHKLFKNLIENAIKYSDENKEIKLMLHGKDGHVTFVIEDQGYGIRLEHQQRIFERFYRVDKGRLDGGTGLGLAIVKHIVIKYKGKIQLESSLGVGTKILIEMQ